MRKQSNHKPKGVNPWAYQNVIRMNSPFTTEEAMLISYQGWDSFDRLLTGIADQEDLQAMESVASVMRIVSKSLPDVVDVADKAIEAAKRGKERSNAGLDGDGIKQCRLALRYFDDVLFGGMKRGTFMEALADVQEARNASNEMVA